MDKHYFFFDIDGTLTDRSTGKIVPSAQRALDELQEKGHFVAIATGRAPYKAFPFLHEVGLTNMVCGGGAALVVDDQLESYHPLNHEAVRQIAKEADALGYGCLFAIDDSIKVVMKDDRFRQQVGPRQEPTEYVLDPDLDFDHLPEVYKLYISIPVEQEHRLTTRKLEGSLRFVPEYLMFQFDEKHQGILEMMSRLKGDLSKVVVFGDDTNDLVMFDEQWTSIAMGNAHPDLKKKATFVTKNNVDDGIWYACKHYGWL